MLSDVSHSLYLNILLAAHLSLSCRGSNTNKDSNSSYSSFEESSILANVLEDKLL